MSYEIKDGETLVFSSHAWRKQTPVFPPRNRQLDDQPVDLTLILTYNQNLFRFVPRGGVKVVPCKIRRSCS
jgi:hypothetical protein